MNNKNFRISVEGTEARNKARYEALINMAIEDSKEAVIIPDVVYALPQLEEYISDFLKTVDCDIRITVVVNPRPYLQFYIFRNSKNELIDSLGFAVDVTFIDLMKLDIPHLGDYIFEMWNSYVTVIDDVNYYSENETLS